MVSKIMKSSVVKEITGIVADELKSVASRVVCKIADMLVDMVKTKLGVN